MFYQTNLRRQFSPKPKTKNIKSKKKKKKNTESVFFQRNKKKKKKKIQK